MDNDWETEKQFLLGVGKFITGLAAAVVAFYLLAPLLPGWLVQFIAMGVGLGGVQWALRGTPFDPFGPRRR